MDPFGPLQEVGAARNHHAILRRCWRLREPDPPIFRYLFFENVSMSFENNPTHRIIY